MKLSAIIRELWATLGHTSVLGKSEVGMRRGAWSSWRQVKQYMIIVVKEAEALGDLATGPRPRSQEVAGLVLEPGPV